MDWKEDSSDSIFVIVNQLMKIVFYKLVKVTINTLRLAEIIINVLMRYHGFPNLIVTAQSLLLVSKFWLLLSYFLSIKQKFSTAFYLSKMARLRYKILQSKPIFGR